MIYKLVTHFLSFFLKKLIAFPYLSVFFSLLILLFLVSISLFLFWFVWQHKKPADSLLLGCSSRSPDNEGHASPKYSDRLSPAINTYLSEASRQEVRVCSGFAKLLILTMRHIFYDLIACLRNEYSFFNFGILLF